MRANVTIVSSTGARAIGGKGDSGYGAMIKPTRA
jgi:hypothetical protein